MKTLLNILAIAAILVGTSSLALAADEPAGGHDATTAHAAVGHGHGAEGHAEPNTNPLSIDPDLAICTAIVFVLLLLFLGKFAWRPIMAGLEKRESSIAENIQAAEESAAKAAQQLEQYEKRLAAAAEEASQIVANAQREAETRRQQIVAEAEAAAAKERERAIEDIKIAKNAALSQIAEASVNTAVGLASNIVRREIKASDHSQLIKDALDQFPSRN